MDGGLVIVDQSKEEAENRAVGGFRDVGYGNDLLWIHTASILVNDETKVLDRRLDK